MTYEEACAIAQRHLDEEPLAHPDYRWRLTSGRELPDGWYFDYAYEPVRPAGEVVEEQFGGSPGFIVSRADPQVHVLSWEEYFDRNLDQPFPNS